MQPTNLQFQPIAYDVTAPTEEAVEAGAPAQAMITIVAGLPLPIANPNTGEPVVVPLAQLQFPLDKEHLLNLSKVLAEKAEELPDPKPQSDILIAGNMGEAEKAAQAFEQFGPQNK